MNPRSARACMIDAGIVDLVENPVTRREPDTTVAADRDAEAALRARSPPCRNARPSRRKHVRFLTHDLKSLSRLTYGTCRPRAYPDDQCRLLEPQGSVVRDGSR